MQLGKSLDQVTEIKADLLGHSSKKLKTLGAGFLDAGEVLKLIKSTLKPEAPVLLVKGEVIADGVNIELDELRHLLHSGKEHLDSMLERESEQPRIPR